MKYVLYGCGMKAEEFIYRNRYVFSDIEICIDSFRRGDFHGIPIKRIEEIGDEELQTRHIIIAAKQKPFFEMKGILESKGLREFEDFEWSECYKKTIVIINANCYGDRIVSWLKKSPTWDRYFLYPLPRVYLNTRGEIGDNLIEHSNVFLHQDIRKENGHGEKLADEYVLSKFSGETICFPNCVNMGHWMFPQLETDEKVFIADGKGYSFYRDKIIEEGLNKYRSKEDIKAFYQNFQYSNDYLLQLYESDMKKLSKRERNWDIKLSKFIDENKKRIKIFSDIKHLGSAVFQEISYQIALMLGMELWEKEECGGENIVPVLPCIKEYYDMDFDDIKGTKNMWSTPKFDTDIYSEYVDQYLWFWHNII